MRKFSKVLYCIVAFVVMCSSTMKTTLAQSWSSADSIEINYENIVINSDFEMTDEELQGAGNHALRIYGQSGVSNFITTPKSEQVPTEEIDAEHGKVLKIQSDGSNKMPYIQVYRYVIDGTYDKYLASATYASDIKLKFDFYTEDDTLEDIRFWLQSNNSKRAGETIISAGNLLTGWNKIEGIFNLKSVDASATSWTLYIRNTYTDKSADNCSYVDNIELRELSYEYAPSDELYNDPTCSLDPKTSFSQYVSKDTTVDHLGEGSSYKLIATGETVNGVKFNNAQLIRFNPDMLVQGKKYNFSFWYMVSNENHSAEPYGGTFMLKYLKKQADEGLDFVRKPGTLTSYVPTLDYVEGMTYDEYKSINNLSDITEGQKTQFYSRTSMSSENDVWKKCSFTFIATEDMITDVSSFHLAIVDGKNDDTYTIWLDDISLRSVPNISPACVENSIENGLVNNSDILSFTFNTVIDKNFLSENNFYINGMQQTDNTLNVALSEDGYTISVILNHDVFEPQISYTLTFEELYDIFSQKVAFAPVYCKGHGGFTVSYNYYLDCGDEKIRIDGPVEGTVCAEVTVTNYENNENKYLIFFASYKDNYELSNLTVQNCVVAGGNSTMVTLNLDVTADEEIKLFVWDENYIPKMEVEKITNSIPDNFRYLVDDIFGEVRSTAEDGPLYSGWDATLNGNKLKHTNDTYDSTNGSSTQRGMTMVDSNNNSIVLSKAFVGQNNGTIVFESAFEITNGAINGLEYDICGFNTLNKRSAIRIFTSNGKLNYTNSSGIVKESNVSVENNIKYGIKVVLNLDINKYDIYLNEQSVAKEVDVPSDIKIFDKIELKTAESASQTVKVYFVKLYENALINETFTTSSNVIPSYCNVSGAVSIVENHSGFSNDTMSMQVETAGTVEFPFQNSTDDLDLSIAVMCMADSNSFTISLGNDVVNLDVNNNVVSNISYTLRKNLWYRLGLKVNYSEETANIYLNSRNLGTINFVASNLDKVKVSVTNGSILVDDITVNNKDEIPNDYVAEPQSSQSDGYDIGVLSYPMWREGSHYGWDRISPYAERKPYLGWYDEGTPEVADWQIKWLSENNVDFIVYPFVRAIDNRGMPIKTLERNTALENGYLKAKYQDKLKFAIMWSGISGQSCAGLDDFKDNIVPYWLERYFKNSNYLVKDNRPVLFIYNIGKLNEMFGGSQNTSEAIAYLRNQVKLAGFSDITVLITGDSLNAAECAELVQVGADGAYTYNAGVMGTHSLPQIQRMEYIKSELSGTDLDCVPSATMGRFELPWRGNIRSYSTPAEFEEVLSWIKSELDNKDGKATSKMALLSTLDEYGEGHYIMPSEVYGFAYLNSVEKVFGGEVKNDKRPTDAQKQRMGFLYDVNRMPQKIYNDPIDITECTNVVKGWYFDNGTENWKAVAQTVSVSSLGGELIIDVSDIAEGAISISNLSVPCEKCDYVKIIMKTESDFIYPTYKHYGLIRFATRNGSTESGPEENPAITFPVYKRGYGEYYVPLANIAEFKGTLKSLNITPFRGSSQKIYIKSIEIIGRP